jgi:hypothetical protein
MSAVVGDKLLFKAHTHLEVSTRLFFIIMITHYPWLCSLVLLVQCGINFQMGKIEMQAIKLSDTAKK